MGRRRQNRGGSRSGVVQVVQDMAAPVGVYQQGVEAKFMLGSSTQYEVVPGTPDLPTRPTSAVLNLTSANPSTWVIRAYSAGSCTYESRPFTTCGSTITVRLRNSKNSLYKVPGTADKGVAWAITCNNYGTTAEDSGISVAAGTCTFSTKGTSALP